MLSSSLPQTSYAIMPRQVWLPLKYFILQIWHPKKTSQGLTKSWKYQQIPGKSMSIKAVGQSSLSSLPEFLGWIGPLCMSHSQLLRLHSDIMLWVFQQQEIKQRSLWLVLLMISVRTWHYKLVNLTFSLKGVVTILCMATAFSREISSLISSQPLYIWMQRTKIMSFCTWIVVIIGDSLKIETR